MEISQRLLGMLFVWATALGFSLGGLYDVLRITRILCGVHYVNRFSGKENPFTAVCTPPNEQPRWRRRIFRAHRTLFIFLGDVLFGVVCGVALIILLYYANDGQFRFLAVFGMACGFFVYYHTLGRLVMLFSEAIVLAIRRLVRWTVQLVLVPLRAIARLLYRAVGQRIVLLVKRIRYKRNVRYTDQAIDACVRLASQGFGLTMDPAEDGRFEDKPQ